MLQVVLVIACTTPLATINPVASSDINTVCPTLIACLVPPVFVKLGVNTALWEASLLTLATVLVL